MFLKAWLEDSISWQGFHEAFWLWWGFAFTQQQQGRLSKVLSYDIQKHVPVTEYKCSCPWKAIELALRLCLIINCFSWMACELRPVRQTGWNISCVVPDGEADYVLWVSSLARSEMVFMEDMKSQLACNHKADRQMQILQYCKFHDNSFWVLLSCSSCVLESILI